MFSATTTVTKKNGEQAGRELTGAGDLVDAAVLGLGHIEIVYHVVFCVLTVSERSFCFVFLMLIRV